MNICQFMQQHARICCLWAASAMVGISLPSAIAASPDPEAPIRIAFIGYSSDSAEAAPVFAGVLEAVKQQEGGGNRPIEVLNWTPRTPQASDQADALRRAYIDHLNGVIISPVDGEALAPVIEFLVGHGIPVVTVNGNAAAAEATAHCGAPAVEIGRQLARELIRAMGQRPGPVAILGGGGRSVRTAELLRGIREVLDEAKIPIHGVFECAEDATARNVVKSITRADRDRAIRGWIFLGPWPLITGEDLPWHPQRLPTVAADVVPVSLSYIKNRQVTALVAEDSFSCGQRALRIILAQKEEQPVSPPPSGSELIWVITADNLAQHLQQWMLWMQ